MRSAFPLALPCSCVFLGMLVLASLPAAASDLPQVKPMKTTASGDAAKGSKAAPAEQPAVASVAPSVQVDPLEQLRQRLASKLAGGKVTETGAPMDLRVVAKAVPSTVAAPAPGHATGHAPATKSASRAKAAPVAHGGQAHWGYQGAAGPQTWGGLKPEFSLCGKGERQSPIDIRGGLAVDLDPVKFNYQPTPFGVIDNGHTVQANMGLGNSIEMGGKRFDLVQLHFHRPSEERIDGRQFEMSVHLVHKDDQGRQAVVAVLMDKGTPQLAVQKVWNNLPLEKGEESAARVALDLNELLPADRRYYTYMGSLTTPPCSEGVQWVVMRQPVGMSAEQIVTRNSGFPSNIVLYFPQCGMPPWSNKACWHNSSIVSVPRVRCTKGTSM